MRKTWADASTLGIIMGGANIGCAAMGNFIKYSSIGAVQNVDHYPKIKRFHPDIKGGGWCAGGSMVRHNRIVRVRATGGWFGVCTVVAGGASIDIGTGSGAAGSNLEGAGWLYEGRGSTRFIWQR